MAAGSAETMSAALVTRLQNTDICENNASAFSEPLQSAGVLEAAQTIHRGRRLANQRQNRYAAGERFTQGWNKIQRAPAGGRGDYAQAGAAATVTVGHRRSGKLVLGQHGGDVRPEICCVVEVLDVGAVDAEDVLDSGPREMTDDVVDHPVLSRHTRDTTRGSLGFNAICW